MTSPPPDKARGQPFAMFTPSTDIIRGGSHTHTDTVQRHSLVVEEDVAALDVPVEEVLAMAVVEPLQQLPHDAGVGGLVEFHHTGLQKAHQVVVHILEHQVERSLILPGDMDSVPHS